jgi:biopolymer transport protein ExbD
MSRVKHKVPCKPNLIPILDAIFIFIFFLLMSAQFIDIFQFGTEAPIIASSQQAPKEPLNLTLSIGAKKIKLMTGMNNTVVANYTLENIKEISAKLTELKLKHPDEKTIILKPETNIDYQKIVLVVDAISGDADKKAAFPQVIFETQE